MYGPNFSKQPMFPFANYKPARRETTPGLLISFPIGRTKYPTLFPYRGEGSFWPLVSEISVHIYLALRQKLLGKREHQSKALQFMVAVKQSKEIP